MSHTTLARSIVKAAGMAVLILLAGCTMKKQDAPPLAGPSGLATSLTMTASPDTIPQDGASQSVIAVVARDADNQPIANMPLRVDLTVNGFLANDFGRLSAQNITTGSDGRASVVYTAPAMPPGGGEAMVRIYVTPVGTNYDNAMPWTVSIRLVEPAIMYVPGSPTAMFSYSPSNPKVAIDVYFDASSSFDDDGSIMRYQWVYGDGDIEYGQTQLHDFPLSGNYSVTLTVTDNAGLKASTTRTIVVSP